MFGSAVHSLEAVTAPLAALLATAAQCEARIFRSALARLAARAAGLSCFPFTCLELRGSQICYLSKLFLLIEAL